MQTEFSGIWCAQTKGYFGDELVVVVAVAVVGVVHPETGSAALSDIPSTFLLSSNSSN
jgi:hypothetical protein